VTRKTQVVLSVAVVVTGLAVVIPLWLTRNSAPPIADATTGTHSDSTPSAQQPPAPLDAQALVEVREAYQQVMAEGGPPGLAELLQGRDTHVTQVRYDEEPPRDLPPLPPELASRPELLPPPDESTDLPPLPPK
jgi:hypothetical protein